MNPIVREFINTDERLGIIIEKYYNKEQYLELILFKMNRAGETLKGFDDVHEQLYLDVDQVIIKGHPDSSLYLLFISHAIYFLSVCKQYERANVLLSIGSSLPREKLPPIILSYFISSMVELKYFEKKNSEWNNLLKEPIAIIDKKCPQYITILLRLAFSLSTQGRLIELNEEDIELLETTSNERRAYSFVSNKILNCIVTGNFIDGLRLLEELKKVSENIKLEMKTYVYTIQHDSNLLKILSGDFEEKNYQEGFFKIYVNICKFLALGNINEAIKYHENLEKGNWEKVFHFHFQEYILLHIELSLKHTGMARLLLLEKNQNYGVSFLDDFFLARIQLLEMNKEGAYESFYRLMENVERYGAMGRLLFELQFAKEMKTSDILLLMHGIRDSVGIKNALIKKEELSTSNKPIKKSKFLIGDSLAITQIKKLVKKFAKLKEPVLITGETGTGKELVSRAIHEEGFHSKESFLAINCGALTDSLLQSELFGYEAGAFTGAQKEHKGIFEAAGKGTVFLDEFGDISPKMQVSLLRVLESNEIRLIGGTKTRQIECKIVIATNIDLHQAVENKRFREDLYFRLARFDIKLPPLRDRSEDIPLLINYFLDDKKDFNSKQKRLSKNLLDALIAYHWPGNIRELKNEIERLKILHAEKEILELEDFDFTRLQGEAFQIPKQVKDESEKKILSTKSDITKLNLEDNHILEIVQRSSKGEQRQELIKGLFGKFKKLTRKQIMEITSLSAVTVSNDLAILCNAGFIEKRTPTKSVRSYYFEIKE